MRKLFVSFTGTLRALKNGSVTESDLASGLFYFGCARQHALDPWEDSVNEVLWFFKDDPAQGRVVHEMLAAAIMKGESEGRVIWRDPEEGQSYKALNGLLEEHGVGSISYEYDGRTINTALSYCYPGVVDRVTEAGLQLQVVS